MRGAQYQGDGASWTESVGRNYCDLPPERRGTELGFANSSLCSGHDIHHRGTVN
jgi:hypothetical protein